MSINKTVDRRTFLGGIGATAALVATSGLAACSPSDDAQGTTESTAEGAAGSSTSTRSWENPPAPIAAEDIVETIECDVAIIGAGIAGLVCAHSAAMNGANVALIEKMGEFSARGHDNGVVNCKWQKEQGIEFDTAQMQREYSQLTGYRTNANLLNIWLTRSAEPMDYYVDKMASVGVTDLTSNKPSNMDSDNVTIREYQPSIDFGELQVTDDGESIQHRLCRYIEQWAQEEGAQVYYNTKAEQLLRDGDGPVTGVVASTADGYVQFNASKGVVLATGDISGNDEMMQEFCPILAPVECKLYTPIGANTGDGINMACWIGAALQKTNAAGMALPAPAAPGGPLASDGVLGWLGVNTNGQRYFPENSGGPTVCYATSQQPGSIGYSIFDGAWRDKILIQAPDGKNRNGVEYLGDKYGVNEGYEGLEDWMENAKQDGLFFEADTLEELAEQIGAEPEVLKKTVDDYNALCAEGVDTLFGKPEQFLTTVEEPPFYASRIKVAVLVVPYGVNVDSQTRVCDKDDKPIENLYAIGNVQGNFLTDRYPMIFPGISQGRAMTFGWVLGEALANDELIS